MKSELSSEELIDVWREIIIGDEKSWVLFEYGTVVISKLPQADLSAFAVDLMTEYGVVRPGSPAGDFSVKKLREHEGWVVSCHHPDILSYVSTKDIDTSSNDVVIGLLGRSRRDTDARTLKVQHVEDRHAARSSMS